jgi:methylenetetrahydrofolate dehydrogenase (NADP+)/methenyltetrahydrofolate cyclohydrolase
VAEIIDGKAVAAAVREEVRAEAAAFRERVGRPPGLATVLVGDDPASATYVRSKRKDLRGGRDRVDRARAAGGHRQDELLALVEELNARADADGILVQLPLPRQINASVILDAIDPGKDVDGLHPMNQARLVAGRRGCAVHAARRDAPARHTGVELQRRPRSGRRAQQLSSASRRLPAARAACDGDRLPLAHARSRGRGRGRGRVVAAIGKAQLIRGDWIKPGAVVIDVGTTAMPPASWSATSSSSAPASAPHSSPRCRAVSAR